MRLSSFRALGRAGLLLFSFCLAVGLHGNAQLLYMGTQATFITTGLSGPTGLATDSSGNLFIADTKNNRIVKVTPAGTQSVFLSGTVAGKVLSSPTGLAEDWSGSLFVSDSGNNRVLRITPNNIISTVGSGLLNPQGIANDFEGGIYIADTGNNRILQVDQGTQVVLISSSDLVGGLKLSGPTAVSSYSGTLVIADTGNNRVIIGSTGGSFYYQQTVGTGLNKPAAVWYLNNGSVYTADTGNGRALFEYQRWTDSGSSYLQVAMATGLSAPGGVTDDNYGNIYIADTGHNKVLRIAAYPSIDFGQVNIGATGSTVSVPFFFTSSTKVSAPVIGTQGAVNQDFIGAAGSTCVAQTYAAGASCFAKVTFTPKAAGVRAGAVTFTYTMTDPQTGDPISIPMTIYLHGIGAGPQIAYDPGVQTTLASGFVYPRGIAVDGNGNVFVADFGNGQINKVTPTGTKSVLATLEGPASLAIDGAGYLYSAANGPGVGNVLGNYEEVYKISPTGTISTANSSDTPLGVAVDGAGDLFTTVLSMQAVDVTPPWMPSIGPFSSLEGVIDGGFIPIAVALDSYGNAYIVDEDDSYVWRFSLSTGAWSLVASGLNRPKGLAVDSAGNVFVADFANNQVVKVAPSGQKTVVGSGLKLPAAVTLDAKGNLYIADAGDGRVVKIDRSTLPTLSFASTKVGTTSSDSPKQVTVENIGNAALSFPPPVSGTNASLSANFGFSSATTCPRLTTSSSTTTLAKGATCNYLVSFAPTAAGTITGALNMIDNNLNVAKATQSVTLKGTATAATAAVQLLNLAQTYTGLPALVTAKTNPAGLKVVVTYNGKPTPPTAPGSYAVVATVTDPNYKGSASGTLVISKITPSISWVTPAPIHRGTPLSSKQLNATAKPAGRFVYSPATGTKLPRGTATLRATFTPVDAEHYDSTSATVQLTVR